MFTIKPRNEKRLIREVVIGDEAKKLQAQDNSSQFGSDGKKLPSLGGSQIREDAQLPPTPIESKNDSIPIPEEVGYVSNYPAWAHVQAWLYYAMLPVYALQLYSVVSNQKDFSEYTIEDLTVSADFTSPDVIIPMVSILVIFLLITCIYSHYRVLRYVGAIVAAAAIGAQINLGFDYINSIIAAKTERHGFEIVLTALGESYFYIIALSVMVLLFTFVYLLLPKYKKSFKKPL